MLLERITDKFYFLKASKEISEGNSSLIAHSNKKLLSATISLTELLMDEARNLILYIVNDSEVQRLKEYLHIDRETWNAEKDDITLCPYAKILTEQISVVDYCNLSNNSDEMQIHFCISATCSKLFLPSLLSTQWGEPTYLLLKPFLSVFFQEIFTNHCKHDFEYRLDQYANELTEYLKKDMEGIESIKPSLRLTSKLLFYISVNNEEAEDKYQILIVLNNYFVDENNEANISLKLKKSVKQLGFDLYQDVDDFEKIMTYKLIIPKDYFLEA
jgi:hypothetical protein